MTKLRPAYSAKTSLSVHDVAHIVIAECQAKKSPSTCWTELTLFDDDGNALVTVRTYALNGWADIATIGPVPITTMAGDLDDQAF